MERFSELNIHGRHPKDLPDKETINDILLELQDTRKTYKASELQRITNHLRSI